MVVVEDFTYSTLHDTGDFYCVEDKVFKEFPVKRRAQTKPKTLMVCDGCGHETMMEPRACPECGSYQLRKIREIKTDLEMYFELVEDPWGGESVVRTYYPKDQFEYAQVYQIAWRLDQLWKKKFKEWEQLQKATKRVSEEKRLEETDWERRLKEYG